MKSQTRHALLRVIICLLAIAGCTQPEPPEDTDVSQAEVTTCLPDDEVLVFPNAQTFAWAANSDVTSSLQAAITAQNATTNPTHPRILSHPTLLLPAGTFHISSTILMQDLWGLTIQGSFTGTTTLQWTGPAGQDMFVGTHLPWFKMNRIIFDGSPGGGPRARVAIHQIETPNPNGFNSAFHEYNDDSFRNFDYAIVGGVFSRDPLGPHAPHNCASAVISPTGCSQVGTTDPDCVNLCVSGMTDTGSDIGGVTIRRSYFDNMAQEAIVSATGNTLDWNIFDSRFSGNWVGIHPIGGGTTNVFHSTFLDSKAADILDQTWGYGMIRENTSIGSARFLFTASPGSVSVIHNNIDNRPGVGVTGSYAVQLQTTSTLQALFLDNSIIVGPGVSNIALKDDSCPLNLGTGGNRFSVSPVAAYSFVSASACTATSQVPPRNVFLGTDSAATFTVTEPAKPLAASHLTRTIYEVTSNASGQCCVSSICGECSTRLSSLSYTGATAVHFVNGPPYILHSMIYTPAGADVVYVGDGPSTLLLWNGPSTATNQAFFKLPFGSRASVRDMLMAMDANHPELGVASGVIIDTDTNGGRIYGDQVEGQAMGTYLSQAATRDNLAVRWEEGEVFEMTNAFEVTGGGLASSSSANTLGVRVFGGGASAVFDRHFKVNNYGKIVVQGFDSEAGGDGGLISGSGYPTLVEGRMWTGDVDCWQCITGQTLTTSGSPFKLATGFAGRASFLNIMTGTKFDGTASPTGGLYVFNTRDNWVQQTGVCSLDPLLACTGPFQAADGAFTPNNHCGVDTSSCGYVALGSSTTQGAANGGYIPAGSGCAVLGSTECLNSGAAAATVLDRATVDLRAASSGPMTDACTTTDVRFHRLWLVGQSSRTDFRLMPYGVRIN